MSTYVVKWSNRKSSFEKVDRVEYDEFSVGDDPDPISQWVVSKRHHYADGAIDYWIKTKPATRLSEAMKPGQCVAGSVELLHVRDLGESRLAQLARLAIQIEKSRAIMTNRQPRWFEGLSEQM